MNHQPMPVESQYEQIEAYLAGTLSPEEHQRFEEAIRQDPVLAREVGLHRQLQEMIGDKEYMAFRSTLSRVGADYRKEGQSPSSPWRWLWLLIPAGLALIWWILSSAPEPAIPASKTVSPAPAPAQPHALPGDTLPAPPPEKAKRGDPFTPHPALERALAQPPDAAFAIASASFLGEPGTAHGIWQVRFEMEVLVAGEPTGMEWVLRDNSQARQGKGIPVGVTRVEGEDIRAFAAKNRFRLTGATALTLRPGLYYGQLVRLEDGAVLWTGRWQAGAPE